MIQKERVTSPFDADSEATVVAPVFDSISRQTARMVVPLSSARSENEYTKAYKQNIAAQIPNAPRNINQPFTLPAQYPFITEQIIVSQPRRKSFWRYVAIFFLVMFALCAGTIGGFTLAQYEKKMEKGDALLRQPALKEIKGLPETIEPFEDPNELPETESEETSGIVDPNKTTTPEEPGPHPGKMPIYEDPSEQRERRITTQQEENNQQSPTEQRERKVNRPEQSIIENRRTQQKPVTREEYAREKIKRAIERIGKILN